MNGPEPRWTCELPGWTARPPVVVGDDLVVRAGGELVFVSTRSGEVRRTTLVDPSGDKGRFLLASGVGSGAMMLTSAGPPDQIAVVGVDLKGAVRWELDTGLYAVDAQATTPTEFLLFGRSQGDSRFLRVRSQTGEVIECTIIDWVPDELIASDRGLVAASQSPPGLALLDAEGRPADVYCESPVYDLVRDGSRAAAIVDADAGFELRYLSPQFDTQWTRPVTTAFIGAATGCLAVADGPDGDQIRALDGAGEVLWVSDSLPDPPRLVAVLDRVVAVTSLTSLFILARSDGALLAEHPVGMSATDIGHGYVVVAMDRVTAYANPQD